MDRRGSGGTLPRDWGWQVSGHPDGHDEYGIPFVFDRGHKRKLTLTPPDWVAYGLLTSMPRASDVVPIIPEGEWQNYRPVLEDYTDQLNLDQDGAGSCAWEAIASILMVARMRAGLLHVELNPWTGYARTNTADNGSDPAENCEYAQKYGLIPMSQWPRYDASGKTIHSWKSLPPNADELAAPYKIDEFFRISTREELGSCLCQGIPVNIGVNWSGGGHAITATTVLANGVRIKNSWGNDWQGGDVKPGYAVLPWRQIESGLHTFSCVGCRTTNLSNGPAVGGMAQ